MGRLPGNPLTRKRQVGAVCPDPTAELVDQGRDSSLRIAYSLRDIPIGLVPGSSAAAYLGRAALFLKLVGGFFQQLGKSFQCRGQVLVI